MWRCPTSLSQPLRCIKRASRRWKSPHIVGLFCLYSRSLLGLPYQTLSAGDEWLRTRKRRTDFFMMAAPHDISRNLLEQAFYYYDDEYPGQHAHVRVHVHMTKAAGDLAAGALEYRARLLDSKFCLIPKGSFSFIFPVIFLFMYFLRL